MSVGSFVRACVDEGTRLTDGVGDGSGDGVLPFVLSNALVNRLIRDRVYRFGDHLHQRRAAHDHRHRRAEELRIGSVRVYDMMKHYLQVPTD